MTAFFIADPGAAFCVLEQNNVPSTESIERWREWALAHLKKENGLNSDGSERRDPGRESFVNRIFDYAQLGRDKHMDVRHCARMELAGMLRSIARQVNVKGKGRNRKGEILLTVPLKQSGSGKGQGF